MSDTAEEPAIERQIAELIRLPSSVLSPQRLRRLHVLLALKNGTRVCDIIRKYGLSREGIRKIQKEVRRRKWAGVVADLRRRLQTLQAAHFAPKRGQGRPRKNTLGSILSLDALEAEPAVTLASLVIGSDIQIAVLGIRVEQGHPLSERSLLKPIRNAFKSPLIPDWTRGGIDEWIRLPLEKLRDVDEQLAFGRRACVARNIKVPPLAARFSEDWKFLVLTQCRGASLMPARRLVGKARHDFIECDGSLVSLLEGALYTLRVTQNLRGFLPSLERLNPALEAWQRQYRRTVFQWHSTEKEALQGLRRRLFDFHVRAACGYMFDLTRGARDRIPRDDDFRVFTLAISPRVGQLEPGFNGTALGKFAPFPEFEIPFGLSDARRWTETRLRERLRSNRRSTAFDYVIRPAARQRIRMHFPFELLGSVGADRGKPPLAVALVSVPRQFLMPKPPVALDMISSLAAEAPDLNNVSSVTIEGKEALMCSIPKLIQSIDAAFRANRYGDRVAAINGSEDWWRHLLSGPSHEVSDGTSSIREFGRANLMFEPPFYFPHSVLCGQSADETMHWRLRQSRIPERAMINGCIIERTDNCVFPGYHSDRTRRELYLTYDADFLLREIAARDWALVQGIAGRWSDAARKVVCSNILLPKTTGTWRQQRRAGHQTWQEWFDSADLGSNVMNAIPRRLKPNVDRRALRAWTCEALSQFESSRHLIRSAVETAQRLTLEGREPKAIVVRTKEEILESWRRYFRKFVRDKAIPGDVRREAPVEFNDNTLSNQYERVSFEEDDVVLICETVARLASQGSEERLLSDFERMAQKGHVGTWREALKQLRERDTSPAIMQWVGQALRAFHSPKGTAPATRRRLAAQLERALR